MSKEESVNTIKIALPHSAITKPKKIRRSKITQITPPKPLERGSLVHEYIILPLKGSIGFRNSEDDPWRLLIDPNNKRA